MQNESLSSVSQSDNECSNTYSMFKRKKGRPRKNQPLSQSSGGLLEDKRMFKRQRKMAEHDIKFEDYASKPNLVARMLKADTKKEKEHLLAKKRAIE